MSWPRLNSLMSWYPASAMTEKLNEQRSLTQNTGTT